MRTRPVNAGQARAYVSKLEEYLAAAANDLGEAQSIAATSLAIHGAINAADAVTGVRVGRRAAGQDGAEVERNLARLLPLKTKAEYEPDDIAVSEATRAVERARRCVAVARRLRLEPRPSATL